MFDPVFAPLDMSSPEPVSPRVYREIRGAIVGLKLRPGQVISELDLARQFGASRQPVHDAFIRLQTAGLIVVRPQRGTMIARISPKWVRDAQVIREAIETAVVRRACAVPRAGALDQLRRNLVAQREAAERRDSDDYLRLDEEFHRLLSLCADMEMAWTIIEDSKSHMDRVRFLSLPAATPLPTLIRQHEAIVSGIESGDPDAAEAAVREHLGEIDKSLPELRTKHPDLFDAEDPVVAKSRRTA